MIRELKVDASKAQHKCGEGTTPSTTSRFGFVRMGGAVGRLEFARMGGTIILRRSPFF